MGSDVNFDWEANDIDDWHVAAHYHIGPRLFKKNAFRPSGVKHQNFDLILAGGVGGALTSGTLQVAPIDLHFGLPVTNLHWLSGTTALVAGSGQSYWTALFDKAGAFLGQSANNTGKAIAASSIIKDALSAPYTCTYTGLYYIGILNAQTGGTTPTFGGFAGAAGVASILTNDGGLKFSGSADASLTTTAPTTLGTITGVATIPWVGVS